MTAHLRCFPLLPALALAGLACGGPDVFDLLSPAGDFVVALGESADPGDGEEDPAAQSDCAPDLLDRCEPSDPSPARSNDEDPEEPAEPPPDDEQPPRDATPPGDPPPPTPPPGDGLCEATGDATCWYVAADATAGGDGSFDAPYRVPQDAVTRALPGDFIYLRGGAAFTHDNAFIHAVHGAFVAFVLGGSVSAGTPDRPITLKSYPGEQAVVQGVFEANGHLAIRVGKSHWRIEGLRMYQSTITVGSSGSGLGIRDVWIVGNHLSDVIATKGNFGILTVTGQHTQGDPIDHDLDPIDIFVHDNKAHTLWGEQPDGSIRPWDEDVWIEHHACFMLQKSGGFVELLRNELYECANIFYSKWEGPGPFVARDNFFHTARNISYRWRSHHPEFENNVFARFTRSQGAFDITQTEIQGAVFQNNTFDLAGWAMNPGGTLGAVRWNSDGTHLFRGNVVFGPQYFVNAPSAANDIDDNCAVWDENLMATSGYSWAQYQAALGHDANSERVMETNRDAVFAAAGSGDFTLLGQAASSCSGMGAQ